jgi:hypothetical protein
MTKHRLDQYAIFDADHRVVDLFEFRHDAETVLKEHETNGDYVGAIVRPVRVTVEPQKNQMQYDVEFVLSYRVDADNVMGAVDAAMDDFDFSDLKYSDITVRLKGLAND